MTLSESQAREQLRASGLRATSARLAVLQALSRSPKPLAHSELVKALGPAAGCDPATVFRTLTRLVETGLATVVSQAGGMDRYALGSGSAETHEHPHFICSDCGSVSCLDVVATPSLEVPRRWRRSVQAATLQLQGRCPDCLA
ncbi:MAG: transcriptional repressor [Planctomycetes bacterium]|jgi:Fur family ferric uptake transcriptional regulator|nr:transcriptional repressor [Planctomycetota bacterium]